MTRNIADDRNHDIRLPFLDLSDLDDAPLMLATPEQRWKVLDRLLEQHGESRDRIPSVWREYPLRGWCWLVLTVNNLDFDPEMHQPLNTWGIDLGFASTGLRRWIWFLA